MGDRLVGDNDGGGDVRRGWRIIATLGSRIAKLDPPQGFAAQTACASILWATAHYGFPVSTSRAPRVGAGMEVVTRLPMGDGVVFVLAGAIAASAFLARRAATRRAAVVPA